jgi:hypothetical protein
MVSRCAKVEFSRPAQDRGYPILTSSLMEGRYVCCVLSLPGPESGAFSSLPMVYGSLREGHAKNRQEQRRFT